MPKAKEKSRQEEPKEKEHPEEKVKKKKHRKAPKEQLTGYLLKILKDVNPSTGISKKGMNIMSDLVNGFIVDVSLHASTLVRQNKKRTLDPKNVSSAIKIVVPKLAGRLIDAGHESAERFNAYEKQ